MYKKLIAVALLGTISLYSNNYAVMAQETIQENITITGDSLQGLDSRSVVEDLDKDKTPKLNVIIERDNKPETFSTGNEFIDSLMNKSANQSPSITNGLNTNKGDVPTTGSGTIPLVNF
ncbi:hypothetical protein [Geminocystis sp. GBBB08]|uniref:hypothetical protein n=1 Tax=Geminocystis sp. GBBB08 TaxID=2604140 RepID=UPI0027E2F2C8|nr:hypothetical protein [Geminocystis sp. GBBB08]MBL1210307.1 hypothetical protein [Geminocystis sp. GBBB08]